MPVDLQREIIHSSTCETIQEGLIKKVITSYICSGFEINETGEQIPREYKRTVTETCGPRNVMERRKWARFGETATRPFTGPVYGEEVYLKLPGKRLKKSDMDDPMFYRGMAVQCGFTPLELNAVRMSDEPKETFHALLNEKYTTKKEHQKAAVPVNKSGIGFLLRNDREKKKSDEYLCTLMLDNVPSWYTYEDIKEQVEEFAVERINLVKPKNDEPFCGKAFVVFNTEQEAQYGLSILKGAKWDNHIISAQVSRPRPISST